MGSPRSDPPSVNRAANWQHDACTQPRSRLHAARCHQAATDQRDNESRGLKLADPAIWDGRGAHAGAKLRTFLHDLSEYYLAKPQTFNNDTNKILYATSRLGADVKNAWRERHPEGLLPCNRNPSPRSSMSCATLGNRWRLPSLLRLKPRLIGWVW
ncbi:hypothetical protein CDV57_08975 [Aspergillus fumigatus]|nr:hypothetical protein CDV57_08975 [Aspergillus fumigatus]